MPHHTVEVVHESTRSAREMFATLADHAQLRRVFRVPVKRIRDGERDVNGVGSVRRIGFGLLRQTQLLRDCALPRLGDFDNLRVYKAGKHGKHQQECEQLDDHRPIDLDDPGCTCAREEGHFDYLAAGTLERKTKPKARLMKYIASTRPTIVNNQGIMRP